MWIVGEETKKGVGVWCKVRAWKATVNVTAMVTISSDDLSGGLIKGMNQRNGLGYAVETLKMSHNLDMAMSLPVKFEIS